MKITFISDTHNEHSKLTKDLPGGDLIIHGGDISSEGYKHEINNFCKWFDKLDNYEYKVFIAGNHDKLFENDPETAHEIVSSYKWISYIQDNWISVGKDIGNLVKIWGSPWQPEFGNWAFNLPKNGIELAEKWNKISPDIDILITHVPAFGYLDMTTGGTINFGCELLKNRIKIIKPKIHICGHIHTGYGYKFDGYTHFINASALNEQYEYTQMPLTMDWNKKTNKISFICTR